MRSSAPSAQHARQASPDWRADEAALAWRGFGQGSGNSRKARPMLASGSASSRGARHRREQPDIGRAGALDLAEEPRHAVDEDFAADEADIGMGPRLGRQMLAGAEADLEPDLTRRRANRAAGSSVPCPASGSTISSRAGACRATADVRRAGAAVPAAIELVARPARAGGRVRGAGHDRVGRRRDRAAQNADFRSCDQIGPLPGEAAVGVGRAAEMAVGRGARIDRPVEA